jgi:hypothetical protein
MTTYGPTLLSLADRLAAADLIARVAAFELLRTEDDPASEHGRELGTFRLALGEVIGGEQRDAVDVLVARRRDADWPLPEKGEFLALVQLGDRDQPGQLVHDSAFPISDDTVLVDVAAGLGGERANREKVTLGEVRELLAARDEGRRLHDGELDRRERAVFSPERPPSQEMPDTNGLRDWLDVEHGEGGRSDEPLKAPRSQRPPDETPK